MTMPDPDLTPEALKRLVERLRMEASDVSYLYADDPGETACSQAAAAISALMAERSDARESLAAWDHGSLPHDWTLAQVVDARIDDLRKYMDQVRDTCRRAENAEAELTAARIARSTSQGGEG